MMKLRGSIKGSMRARMTASLALSIALFVLILSAIYLMASRGSLERNFAASLDRMALESTDLARNDADLRKLTTQIEAHNNQVTQSGAIAEGVEAWLIDANQKELWRLGPSHPFPSPSPAENRDIPQQPIRIPPLDRPQDWRIRRVPWQKGTLVLGLPWHRARQDLNRQAVALGILSLLITGAAAFGAWILVGKTLSPITDLTQQARQSALNPVQLMARKAILQPTSSDAEMQDLVATLNQMLDNVHEAALSKERFHTSASHELRTPLQSLAGHLSVTLARERSNAEYKLALQEAAQHTARLTKLTRDLLLLNRLQTAGSITGLEIVDVTEMCDIALQRAEKIIEQRGLEVLGDWQPFEIKAVPSHIEILVGNLVENAAKYGLENGRIGIEIQGASHSIQVWNDCEAEQCKMLEGEIPRLFEPFYRPDTARASDTGGNGLGLAICQTIAESNGWQLNIELRKSKFSVQVVFLPPMY